MLIEECLDDWGLAAALHEVVVQLAEEVPVLDNRGVDTLLQNTLVEGLALSHNLRIVLEVSHILANVRVDKVIEVIIVAGGVVVIVL